MRVRWLLALLPAGLGVTTALLTLVGWLPAPLLYLEGDLGVVSLVLGLLLSGPAVLALLIFQRTERAHQGHLAQIKAQAATDRRRFLQRLDHALKNPLQGIRAALANARTSPDPAEQVEAMAAADEQAVRLSQLVRQLRNLARMETQPLDREPVDVAALLQDVLAAAQERPAAAERSLSLNLPQAPRPLPPISADPYLFALALDNLLDNALKFTHAGDRIEVRAAEDGRQITIEVVDTGPGIPEDELAHVGEELFRGKAAYGRPGSGLGLALVRTVVERHGGRLNIRSLPGKGTVVSIQLPAGEP